MKNRENIPIPVITPKGIKGNIDRITTENGLTHIRGWACDTGVSQSVDVHVYARGPAGEGFGIKTAKANISNEVTLTSFAQRLEVLIDSMLY